jgi:hypothetical protein
MTTIKLQFFNDLRLKSNSRYRSKTEVSEPNLDTKKGAGSIQIHNTFTDTSNAKCSNYPSYFRLTIKNFFYVKSMFIANSKTNNFVALSTFFLSLSPTKLDRCFSLLTLLNFLLQKFNLPDRRAMFSRVRVCMCCNCREKGKKS